MKHEVPGKLTVLNSPEQRSRRARQRRSASVRDRIRPRTDHVVSPEQPWLRLARTCINPFPAMPAWGPQVGWVWRVLLTATSRSYVLAPKSTQSLFSKGTAAVPRQGKTKARCHRRQNPHTYLTLHNIRIGKTPVGWAGSKQEAGQPERGIVSPGLVSFGGTPLSDLERSPSWTADGGRWSACQSDRRSKGRRESGHRDL